MDERTIRDLFATIDATRWERLDAFFAPGAVYERPGLDPLVGLERILRYYREERIIVSGRHHIEQVVVGDDAGACWGRVECVLRDGSEADERFADVYLFSAGRIKLRRSHFYRPAV